MEFIELLAKIAEWGFRVYFWMHIGAFLLSWVAADPLNPIVRFINGVTHPLWHRIEQMAPTALRGLSAYLALMLVLFMELFAPGLIRSLGASLLGVVTMGEGLLNVGLYFALAGLRIAAHVASFIFILALIWFILTLVNPPMNHPLVRSLFYILDPLISPLQRILPRSRIDFSPLILALGGYFLSGYLMGSSHLVARNLLL